MNEHAPGWYEHDGERRYWDGDQWTHSTSLPATPEVSAPPPPPSGAVAPYSPPPAHAYAPPPAYGSAPQGGPYGAPAPGGMMPPRKEPAIAVLISFFVPGVGSMVNGDVGEGIGFLAAYIFGLVLVICLGWAVVGLIGLPISLGIWAWSMFHAYQGAVNHNRAVGYPG